MSFKKQTRIFKNHCFQEQRRLQLSHTNNSKIDHSWYWALTVCQGLFQSFNMYKPSYSSDNPVGWILLLSSFCSGETWEQSEMTHLRWHSRVRIRFEASSPEACTVKDGVMPLERLDLFGEQVGRTRLASGLFARSLGDVSGAIRSWDSAGMQTGLSGWLCCLLLSSFWAGTMSPLFTIVFLMPSAVLGA